MRAALCAAVLTLCGAGTAGASSGLPGRAGMFVVVGGGGGGVGLGTALAQVDSKIAVEVRGPIATATVTQVFRNDADHATEATYIFPLPPDAAVSAMSITVGDKVIRGAIEARAAAQKRYEDAVSAGVGAAILEQERPDVFTQTIAAIPAHATVSVTLRFDTVARFRGATAGSTTGSGSTKSPGSARAATWELALPLVVAPRYVPGTASGRPTTGVGRAPDTDRAPDASRVTPNAAPGAGGRTEVALAFVDPVDNVTSPSHAIAGDKLAYKLVDAKSDHDVIVRWQARTPDGGWVEQDADGGYAAIVVEAPPDTRPAAPPPAARITLLLDRAATTRGDADAVMHPIVRALLAAYGAADRIALAGSDTLAAAAPADALRAVEAGWAKPAPALDLSRALAGTHDGRAIVLVSDGLVADDQAAIAAATAAGVPIHVIGFGPAPNRSLLGAIAAASGGTVRFASTADDLDAIAREIASDSRAPAAPRIAVTWGTLAASDVVPGALPRLGAGQAMLVLARVKSVARANARVRGDVFAIEVAPAERKIDGALTAAGPIARRWARDRLDELLARKDATATAAHALKYGLVSPYTTMVAIGTDVVVEGGVKHSVSVPVSVPAGMRWQEVHQQTRVTTDEPLAKQDVDGGRDHKPPTVAKPPVVAEKPRDDARKTPDAAPPPPPPAKKAPPTTIVAPTAPTATGGGDVAKGAQDDQDGAYVRGFDAKTVEPRSPEPPAPGGDARGATKQEVALEDGETISLTAERRARWHEAIGLTGGFQRFAKHTGGLLVLDGRIEYGLDTRVGLDASFWVLFDEHYAGNLLASVTRRGLFGRWLDLAGGVGAHVIDHQSGFFGPAWSLSLRIHVPTVKGIGIDIRYDGALLRTSDGDPDRHPLTSITTGFEATF